LTKDSFRAVQACHPIAMTVVNAKFGNQEPDDGFK
jgi:hypothetical protein